MIYEIPDSPALLRKPTDDGDEGVCFGDLVDVGKLYKTYEISPGKFTIIEGTVVPNFGQPGGGYQFYVPDPNVVKDY